MKQIHVARVDDFMVDGKSSAVQWRNVEWVTVPRIDGSLEYETKCRMVYSSTGIYVAVVCEDCRLDCTIQRDFADLYTEDVVEVFLQPMRERPLYFEYEISPLNYELPIMVPNNSGEFYGWLPWHYEGERQVRHETSVQGGVRVPGAEVSGWQAEIFIPYALLRGTCKPPIPGDVWHGNVYRIDVGTRPSSKWALFPISWGRFHDYENFGRIVFDG